MSRKVVLVYSRSELARDERVQKQIKLCSRDYDVVSAGLGPYDGPVVRHIDIGSLSPAAQMPAPTSIASQLPAAHVVANVTPQPPAPNAAEMSFGHKLTWVIEREGVTMLALLALRKILPGVGPIERAIGEIRIKRREGSSTAPLNTEGPRAAVARRNNKRMTKDAWSLITRHAAYVELPFPAAVWSAKRAAVVAANGADDEPVIEQLRENFEHFETREIERRHQPIIDVLRKVAFDLAFANDLTSINVVVPLAREKKAKIIYDAHEFSPGQRVLNEDTAWSLYFAAYKLGKYLPLCDQIMTACESSSIEHRKWFDIKLPTTITNAPHYIDLSPTPLDGDRVRLVHHGIASRPRALELMIDTVLLLDERFSLDFYLVTPDLAYFEELQTRCQGSERIRFQPTVPSAKISESINRYDMGFYILPAVNFNQKYALPNKFFEFIQARLGVAIGPSPEMMSYLHKYKIGVVAADFTPAAMAAALAGITVESLAEYKSNSHRHAAELSAAPQMERLGQLVGQVMAADEVAA